MAAQPRSDGGTDTRTLHEIEQDVAQLEQHSFAETPTEGARDTQQGPWRWVIFLAALILAVFHVYTNAVFEGTLPQLQQGGFHLALGLFLAFLLYPAGTRQGRRQHTIGIALSVAGALVLLWLWIAGAAALSIVLPALGVLLVVQLSRYLPVRLFGIPLGDVVLSALGAFSGLYIFINYEEITRLGVRFDDEHIVVGTLGILLVLLAAQRALGSALVILASAMLVYAYLGPNFPGFLHHSGYGIDRIVATSFLGTEAVFGSPIWISATVIFLFLIFAAMLQRTGMERFFTDLALGGTGWATGGTAKVGVVSSAFSGTITGSSVANTVSNGAFTIPMMKKSGYRPEYAGAVEAASSTGGQLAPPIMGAAAFIMIEFTGVPYVEIIQAAIVPAILFFVGQFVVIHFDSKRFGIRGLPKSLLPSVRRLMSTRGYLLIPIVAIFMLLSMGFSPGYAAMGAIAVAVGVNVLVQLSELAVAFVPPRARKTALSDTPTSNRLVGSGILLVAMLILGAVGWAMFRGIAALAPEMTDAARVILTGIVLGVTVAVAGRIVLRRRNATADEEPVQQRVRNQLHAVVRLAVPFAVAAAALWAFFWVLDAVAPEDMARSTRILIVSVVVSVLAVLVLLPFQRWRSAEDDQLSLDSLLAGLVSATRLALPVIVACAAAGLIAGVITLTGLGLGLAGGLVAVAQGHLIPVLILSMLACLVLGIGLPTTANYVITATLAAPAILAILGAGLDEPTVAMLLMAHMFVYYFGVMADITPPVCLAAYAASGISGGRPLGTGVQAVRIAVSGFVVPFMFVLNPQLLLQEVTWTTGIVAVITGVVGASLVGVAVVGYIERRVHWVQRVLLALAGVGMMLHDWMSDLAGVLVWLRDQAHLIPAAVPVNIALPEHLTLAGIGADVPLGMVVSKLLALAVGTAVFLVHLRGARSAPLAGTRSSGV
ncbi:TRAP transporter fused permease subunit [Lipingzhangella sp. LS1_29]|uniref:TRAP transporter fused permease subunit n=1 Tax=Lipingzhangella rawalii TaxID=2055835 RepID=A0ABU2H9Y8_9ACTN|nr:TRAP transporter fused permease subunit [Lipingzhangella rawalii]MDS1271674.1 TRAP transporter fused permease subunit [Lipingzhangella rawalii]